MHKIYMYAFSNNFDNGEMYSFVSYEPIAEFKEGMGRTAMMKTYYNNSEALDFAAQSILNDKESDCLDFNDIQTLEERGDVEIIDYLYLGNA